MRPFWHSIATLSRSAERAQRALVCWHVLGLMGDLAARLRGIATRLRGDFAGSNVALEVEPRNADALRNRGDAKRQGDFPGAKILNFPINEFV